MGGIDAEAVVKDYEALQDLAESRILGRTNGSVGIQEGDSRGAAVRQVVVEQSYSRLSRHGFRRNAKDQAIVTTHCFFREHRCVGTLHHSIISFGSSVPDKAAGNDGNGR